MKKFMFKCPECKTLMTIETELDPERNIHMAPLCPCGKSRMLNMASPEYAYRRLDN